MIAALAVGLAFVAITTPAEAQTVQAFVQWAIGPSLLGSLVGLGIALVGILLMFGQHTWVGIVFAAVGGGIIGNATAIAGYFGGGG